MKRGFLFLICLGCSSLLVGCQVLQTGSIFQREVPVFHDPLFDSPTVGEESPSPTYKNPISASRVTSSEEEQPVFSLSAKRTKRTLARQDFPEHFEAVSSVDATQQALSKFETSQTSQTSQASQAIASPPENETRDRFVPTQYRVANHLEEKLWGGPSGIDIVLSDYRRFYNRDNFRPFALTIGLSAIIANTSMDQEFSDWYQDHVRSESTDDFSRVAKSFGEQWPMVGAYLTASALGRLPHSDTRLALWGDRSFRSMLVGVPPLLFLQKALGSSRPNDNPAFSDWRFWEDENGASGHTFVGAVPFLVAAQLAERPGAKFGWTALSTLPGWSRINDNDHYLSQVIVGWYLAYLATKSVQDSDADLGVQIIPMQIGNTQGLGIEWNF